MTTVATTNPQEAKQVSNPQDAKMADTSDNPQEVRQVLSMRASQPACDPTPAPELNGYLLKHPEKPAIYLILNGYRRQVPNVETLNGLFVTNRTVHEDFHIDLITKGDDIASGATLVKGDGSDPWYLLPGKVKMWIPNEQIFAQHQFRAVTTIPQILVNGIPDGDKIAGRPR